MQMCAWLLRAILLCLLVLAATPPGAGAYDDAYLPLDARLLAKRIKQKLICDPLQMGSTVFAGRTKIEITMSKLLLVNGSDIAGKPWSFAARAWEGCASVWTADLDNNDMEDLIIVMRTGENKLPPVQLLVLMVEKNGRAFPWAVDGHFDVDNKGIKDFLDTDNNGHAELLRQSQDDGYWITSLYEASRSRWHRVQSMAGFSLPLFTRYTEASNKSSIKPPAYRHPFEADLSNDCKDKKNCRKQQFLDSIEWPQTNRGSVPCFLLSDGHRIRPMFWLASMAAVLDEPGGRKMALLSEPNAVRKITTEIAWRRLPVSISGTRSKPGQRNLTSELIYAQSNSRQITKPANQAAHNLDIAISLTNSDPP